MESPGKTTTAVIAAMTALALGLGAGYLIWGWPTNWYARNIEKLPAGDDGDLIRYGHSLIVDTASHIGKTAPDPQKRLAGNDLACVSCHLNAGLQPFAAPFVSTFATFPMLVDDQVLTLKNRINGCMLRSMNGKALPDDGREMDALIAYMKYLGHGTPEGVRIAGMGLLPLQDPPSTADDGRGEEVYAKLCATCHKGDGQGERRITPAVGYSIPPLWGDDSFNMAAGMAKLAYAAAYIRANMPFGIDYREPVLTVQQAWDVAAYMISKPRPPAPPGAASQLH
ncbi:MAG: c-type cytochrome [Methyloceanibacter sp.]|jgi:thiosulfate dehydrogenase